jgi:hypothetical protein
MNEDEFVTEILPVNEDGVMTEILPVNEDEVVDETVQKLKIKYNIRGALLLNYQDKYNFVNDLFVDVVKKYVNYGLYVLPVYPHEKYECSCMRIHSYVNELNGTNNINKVKKCNSSPGEHVILKNGEKCSDLIYLDQKKILVNFKKAIEENKIVQYLAKNKDAHLNLAVLTGSKVNCIALEVNKDEGQESIIGFSMPTGPQTIVKGERVLKTSYYFRGFDSAIPTIFNLLPNVDLKADESFTLVPPSFHSMELPYVFVDDTLDINPKLMPELPKWLTGLVKIHQSNCSTLRDKILDTTPICDEADIKGLYKEVIFSMKANCKELNEDEAVDIIFGISHRRSAPINDEDIVKEAKRLWDVIDHDPSHSYKMSKNGDADYIPMIQDDIEELVKISIPKNENKKTTILGGMFARGYTSIFHSDPGVGKSWLTSKIACDFSCGLPVLEIFPIDEPKHVLYLTGETSSDEIYKRIDSAGFSHDNKFLRIVDISKARGKGRDLCMDTEKGRNEISDLVKYLKPTLVIFDSWFYFFLNKASDSKIGLDFLESLTKENNICTCINHHSVKQKYKEDISNAYGSSTFTRRPAFVFSLEKKERSINRNEGSTTKEILVKCAKNRLGRELDPFSVLLVEYEDCNISMRVNKHPSFGGSKKDKIWDIIQENFGNGKLFKKSDIVELTSTMTTDSYIKTLLKDWKNEKRTIMKGYGPDASYYINNQPY